MPTINNTAWIPENTKTIGKFRIVDTTSVYRRETGEGGGGGEGSGYEEEGARMTGQKRRH